MKRFTVIVAMLALMLGTVATANANLMTNPASGADITTNWSLKGFSFGANASRRIIPANNTYAVSGVVTMTQKTGDNWNLTAAGSYYNGSTAISFPISLFHNQWNTTTTKNSTFLATANGVGDITAVGSWKGLKMGATPDRSVYVFAGAKTLNMTNTLGLPQNNSAAIFAMAQTLNTTDNRLVGTWKIFGYMLGKNTTTTNASYSKFVMGDMIVNSSKTQFGNATIFYKQSNQGAGFAAGYNVDRITLTHASGAVSSGNGDFNWLTNAVLDASGNTLISAGNTTVADGFGAGTGKSGNATAFFVAVRAASDTSAGFSTLEAKKYTILGAGARSYSNASIHKPVSTPVGSYGVLNMDTKYHFALGTSNVTVFNGTNFMSQYTGNGSMAYGTYGIKDKAMGALTIRTAATHVLNGANFTGAMRVDGQMYVGIVSIGDYYQLAVLLPETSDAVTDLSSLSSDFVTDTQFLAATGLNLCPRANASQSGACFELSHANYPTTGLNARQPNAITVSTYVQSVIDAADNATIMNADLLNKTAKADSADYVGNFTSEEYSGAPTKLTSMYAFNATSFQVTNATNDVRLLAKWVFVANGTGSIGNVNDLTAEEADPWKYMKKYQDKKNATAYTKAYGNGTLQNWSKFWDADGNEVALADGVVFYTQYGTNASLLAPMQKTDKFASGTTYVLWAVLANGGLFDLDNSTDFVFDPPRIVTDETIVVSSSSSSGCVFNPVAGFGLEWLLLLLAPAVGIIRSRFRK